MKLKTGSPAKTALTAALLLGSLVSLPASAVTIGQTVDLGDLTGLAKSVGNAFGAGDFGSSFEDVYVFDLSTASQSVGTTVTINLSFGGANFLLSGMEIRLTDSTGATTYDWDNTLDASSALQVSALLGAGNDYRFVVSGTVAGNAGGAYGGVLQAAPVPEAGTYGMMLAGLGLVGLMVRRRARAGI